MSETFSIIVAQWIGSVPLRAPTADGSPNQVLQTDGSGNLSFVTITSGITIDSTAITSGAATRILFENASNQVSSSANFTYQNSLDDATGNEVAHTINYTTNKATSGDDTGLLVNKTDTASPGTSWLQEWQVGGSPLVQIHDSGIIKSSVPSGNITSRSVASSASARHYVGNNGVGLFIGIEDSSGGAVFSGTTAYSGVVGTAEPNRSFHVCTHNTVAVTVDSSQNVAVPAGTLAISGAGAAEIPFTVTGAAAQSVDLAQYNPNGVTAGERARITNDGEFSNSFGVTGSEAFGDGSVIGAGHTYSTVFGNGNTTGSTYQTLIGNTVVGGSGQRVVGIGQGITFPGGLARIICLAPVGTPGGMTSNGFYAGSPSAIISDIYFGEGAIDATPTDITFHGTGGSGTDIAGGDITIAGGIGTGTGVGGDILFQYAAAGASSSTPNSLATAMTINGDTGQVTVGTSTDSVYNAKFHVKAAVASAAVYSKVQNTEGTGFAEFFCENNGNLTAAVKSYGNSATGSTGGQSNASTGQFITNNGTCILGAKDAATHIIVGTSGTAISVDTSANVTIPAGTLAISGAGAAEIPLSITGAAAQSANLSEWKNSSGVTGAFINAAMEIDNNGIGSGPNNTIIGTNAGESFTSAEEVVAIGVGAGKRVTSMHNSIFIGWLAGQNATTGYSNIIIGSAGGGNFDTGLHNTAIGHNTVLNAAGGSSAPVGAIAIGSNSATRSSNQFVAGSLSYPINTVHFGSGVYHTSPTAYSINGTGGSGTDVAGANIIIAGGKGTGDAAGGDILFQTSDAGASGTTLQSLSTAMTIEGNTGNVTIPAGTLAISGAGAAEIPLSVEAAAAQSANLVNVTSNGGTAGDLLHVDSAGKLVLSTQGIQTLNLKNTSGAIVLQTYHATFDGVSIPLRVQGGIALEGANAPSVVSRTDIELRVDSNSSTSNSAFIVSHDSGAELFRANEDGTFGIGVSSPAEMLQVDDAIAISSDAEGSTARLTRRTAHETHTLAAAGTSDTTTISIPSGARLLGVSFNVNTAVSDDGGDDTWSAAFVTGSTTTLATAAAAAQNTKVNLMLPDEISTGVCQIRFTANGGSFDAGVIEIVAYYEELTSLANV